MAYLWFTSPVPVWINPTCCQQIAHVEEAAEILLYHWPKAAMTDPISVTAQRACYDALRGAGEVESARAAFEAAAREVGVLAR